MSSSMSSIDYSTDSEFKDSEFELEVEDNISTCTIAGEDMDSLDAYAYNDEPLANEEWIEEYNKQVKETEELEESLKRRLDGSIRTDEWCKCGHCETSKLQNISECYCCCELDGCRDSLESDLVAQDLNGSVPVCITEHPGFNAVCLQKWSLRLAADKYRKTNKKPYKQEGCEEKFLRSVAYREFTRMVYGFLGKKRYPLPACAYSEIRKTFFNENEQGFTGFEMEDM